MAEIVDIKDLDFIIDEEIEELDFTLQSYIALGGTSNYNELINHPYINEREVIGRKTGPDYGLQNAMDEITPQQIDNIIFG